MTALENLVILIILFCLVGVPALAFVSRIKGQRATKGRQGVVGAKGVLVDGKWISFAEAEKKHIRLSGFYEPPKPRKKHYWKVRLQ